MAIEAIEFDKVREGQAAVLGGFDVVDQVFEQVGIAALDQMIDPPHRKNIANLADRIDRPPRALHPITQGRAGRCDGEIATVLRTGKTAFGIPDKRARNHAPHPHFMQERRQTATQVQQVLKAKVFLMCGDLKHAIRRGIADRPSGPDMLGPQLCDDLGP